MPSSQKLPLYTKALMFIAFQAVIISFLCSFYRIEIPIRATGSWLILQISKAPLLRSITNYITIFDITNPKKLAKKNVVSKPKSDEILLSRENLPLFTSTQLALFDGSRSSKPVYLALLGRVYNVEKGRKHYAKGGGYSFFAGRDATRAFVTGDFTPEGLIDDLTGLSEGELLSIFDWITFYDKEYVLVGLLEGRYYNSDGKPTKQFEEVTKLFERAKIWKEKQMLESEVFPPCNSEWQADSGGRVWCTSKSGGIKRDWVGVPRRLFTAGEKNYRCVCVKNFGNSLASPDAISTRGDLDNPNLKEYDDCSPTANSCKIPLD